MTIPFNEFGTVPFAGADMTAGDGDAVALALGNVGEICALTAGGDDADPAPCDCETTLAGR